jgi:predicted DCC family thiol-disulfide oxidoreductase YuxK
VTQGVRSRGFLELHALTRISDRSAMPAATRPIVFFDGDCALCNASVDLILRADTRRRFLFAPLAGQTAREILPPLTADPGEWSIVLLDEDGVREQSDAALAICRELGGAWTLLGLLRALPRRLRDHAYRVIARNRYRWFGHHETCRIPTEAERARFLP